MRGYVTKGSIEAEMTVNEVVQKYPSALAVLGELGIDTCCGGSLPLAVAVERHGHDLQTVLQALDQASQEN